LAIPEMGEMAKRAEVAKWAETSGVVSLLERWFTHFHISVFKSHEHFGTRGSAAGGAAMTVEFNSHEYGPQGAGICVGSIM
jgi:hypothetical protein